MLGGGHRSSLRHFQDTDPPRFAKPIQPLDADDWLRTIQNNLEVAEVPANQKVLFATHYLTGPARTWWETTKAHLPANEVLSWEDFKDRFRKVYIPVGLLKRKRDEFRQLKQSNKSVMEYLDQFTELSRYAPDDVDTEEKKKEKFLEGLHDELQIHLVNLRVDTLEALVDATIQLETKRKMVEDNRKRRFQTSGSFNSPNIRARVPTPAPPRPAPRPPQPQQRYQAPPARPFRPPNVNFGRPGNGRGPARDAAGVTCYHCGEKGHYSPDCPTKKNAAPRAPGQGQGRGNGPRLPPPPPNRGRLNHVQAEEAEEAPEVVLGTFLVNSVPAQVLFDSGATHCFATRDFVKRSNLKPTLMTTPLIVQTPHCIFSCQVFLQSNPNSYSWSKILCQPHCLRRGWT